MERDSDARVSDNDGAKDGSASDHNSAGSTHRHMNSNSMSGGNGGGGTGVSNGAGNNLSNLNGNESKHIDESVGGGGGDGLLRAGGANGHDLGSGVDERDRRVREIEDRERQSWELRSGLHPLQNCFVFWYTRRQAGLRTHLAYEDSIKKITDFSTIEGFWSCYCHISRAQDLPNPTDLHLFKDGIRPLWEDFANRNGGKWIIRFRKTLSGRYWEDLVLALVGDQLDAGESVCGAVLSIRFGEDILSVWNRSAADTQAVMSLKDSIKRHLHLPSHYLMEYKPHDASLKDNSSFRNTWLRG